jgi:hypothetical protein
VPATTSPIARKSDPQPPLETTSAGHRIRSASRHLKLKMLSSLQHLTLFSDFASSKPQTEKCHKSLLRFLFKRTHIQHSAQAQLLIRDSSLKVYRHRRFGCVCERERKQTRRGSRLKRTRQAWIIVGLAAASGILYLQGFKVRI